MQIIRRQKEEGASGTDNIGKAISLAKERENLGAVVWAIMVSILLLSAFLLFFQLDAKSLWIDEFDTVTIARQPSFAEFASAYLTSERQPPLHHLTLWTFGQLTGRTDDLAMRFPSALAGVGTVIALFFLGRKMGGVRLGLLAAFLLAISPTFVLYMRMARYYSFSIFFGTLSCLLLLQWLESTSSWKRILSGTGYVVFTLFMLLSAYPTVFVFLMEGIFALHSVRRGRLDLRGWVITHATVVICYGAWIVWILPVMLGYRGGVSPFSIQGMMKVVLTVLYPLYSFSVGETIFPWHPMAFVGLIATSILLMLAVKHARVFSIRFSLHILVGSLLGTFFVFLFVLADIPFITAASRSIFALPFFTILLAAALLSVRRNWLRLVVGVCLVGAYVFSISNYFSNQQFHNPVYVVPTKEIVAGVLAQSSPSDVVISDRDTGVEFYWPNEREWPAHYLSNDNQFLVGSLQEEGKPRVWLVTLGRDRTKGAAPEELIAWLDANYSQKQEWGYAPQDPIYRELKKRVLGYDDYNYKAQVTLYSN